MTNTNVDPSIDTFIHDRSFGHAADVIIFRLSDGWTVSGLFTVVGEIMDGRLATVNPDREAEARDLIQAVREACDLAESRIR